MATQSGIIVRVLSLDDTEIFPQLKGIERSIATCSSQVTPGTRIKIIVRLPEDFEMYSAGGIRINIAIGHEIEEASREQCYWYDAADLQGVDISHSCFYVSSDVQRNGGGLSVAQHFTVPIPQQGHIHDDALSQPNDTIRRGCIVVSLARGNIDIGSAEHDSTAPLTSVNESHPGQQIDSEKQPRVICKHSVDTLPANEENPFVWVFRNVTGVGDSDNHTEPVNGLLSKGGADEQEILPASDRPAGKDSEDARADSDKEDNSANRDVNEEDAIAFGNQRREPWVERRDPFPTEETKAAEWASLCQWLEDNHPKACKEMFCTPEEQQNEAWIKEHNFRLWHEWDRFGRPARKGDQDEEAEIAKAIKRSLDEQNRISAEKSDSNDESLEFDDESNDGGKERNSPQQTRDNGEGLVEQLDGTHIGNEIDKEPSKEESKEAVGSGK